MLETVPDPLYEFSQILERRSCPLVGRTHGAAGLCAGAALTLSGNLDITAAIVVTAQTFTGALLPDLDQRNSTISQAVRPVSMVVRTVLRHRKVLHDPALYALLYGLLWICRREIALFWAPLFLGIASHLLLDACNPSGIPLVYPAKMWRLHLLRIRTGSRSDRVLGTVFSTAAVLLFLGWGLLRLG